LNANYNRYLPGGIAAGLGVAYMLFMMLPPRDPADKMHLEEAAKLPVVEGGRVMPMDTVARNRLMIISGRQTFVDDKGNHQPAIKWLWDVMTTHGDEGPAFNYKVFRIVNTEVLALLKLQPRKGFWRYSLAEILPQFKEFSQEYDRVRKLPPKNREVYDLQIFELGEHLGLYDEISSMQVPLAIPPLTPGEKWRSLREVLADLRDGHADAATKDFVTVVSAYMKDDAKAFNTGLTSYRGLIDSHFSRLTAKTNFETFFNNFAPFYQCAILYVVILVLACASWIAFPDQLKQAAFALTLVVLAVHTFGLLARMYLMGRPLVFITNLYSTAVFVGWMGVILGVVLEKIYRNGLGVFIAGVIGFATQIIAHYLATTGDTLEMMQAVLDTNFWLATHVTTINIGYAATLVAGLLGAVLICLGVFTTKLDKALYKTLGQMIYGIVCFAMLFSFVGTVLGGIWADQSWGRFWGWDPKENGALLIVLMNALILHARWCGMIQQRGMAVLAVGGNIVTAWSWWGVNMLGVGLHAYASTAGQLYWLLVFVTSQLVIVGIGLVPTHLWQSFATTATPSPATQLPPIPVTAITAKPNPVSTRRHVKA
jgi:ABC-type transport system involved in cytochrome c biogenesis permease subunit